MTDGDGGAVRGLSLGPGLAFSGSRCSSAGGAEVK